MALSLTIANPWRIPETYPPETFQVLDLPRSPTPRLATPRRTILLVGYDMKPIPEDFLEGPWPLGIRATQVEVVGPTRRDEFEACLLDGGDFARFQPLAPGRWIPERKHDLFRSLARSKVEMHLSVPGRWLAGTTLEIRNFDRVQSDEEDPLARPDRVLERLWERLRARRWGRGGQELFVVTLQGKEGPWPRRLRTLVGNMVQQDGLHETQVFYVPRPVSKSHAFRARGFGFLVGPGVRPPTARIEVEDVTPSLCALYGAAPPPQSLGIPRLGLLASQDPAGAYGALSLVRQELPGRYQLLEKALVGRSLLRSSPHLPPKQLEFRQGKTQEALAAIEAELLEARRRFDKDYLRTQMVRRVSGRSRRSVNLLPWILFAGLGLAVGLLFGFENGGALAGVLAFLTWASFLGLTLQFLESTPESSLYQLRLAPWRCLFWGIGAAGAALVPALFLRSLGWIRPGGMASAYLISGSVGLTGLGLLFHRYGIGLTQGFVPVPVSLGALALSSSLLALPWGFLAAELLAGVEDGVDWLTSRSRS